MNSRSYKNGLNDIPKACCALVFKTVLAKQTDIRKQLLKRITELLRIFFPTLKDNNSIHMRRINK